MTNTQLDGADRHTDHSDDELVRRWLRSVCNKPYRSSSRLQLLWVRVADTFSIGSVSAKGVCLRHGFDPDKMVRKS